MRCEICNKEIAASDSIVSPRGEEYSIFCKQCYTFFGHCQTCVSNCSCAFMENPDPMPKFRVIQNETRTPMGIQIVQYEVPNGERIKKFCIEGKCLCYNGDDEHPLCCRHGGYATCTNYSEIGQ